MVNLIAAVGTSGQIGLDGKLPWHFKEDLRWFRSLTLYNVVVVGYNTALTLPALDNRTTHIMTRGQTPEQVKEMYAGKELWIAGGRKTYKQWMPYVGRFHISRIDYDGPADTYFPELNIFS